MTPDQLTQPHGATTAPLSIIPTVIATVPIPSSRQPLSPTAYFDLFQPCTCGHSSAWHGGSFGAAWRSGLQVRGRCESDDRGPCGCDAFRPAD
jgi:hypothetical protein